MGIALGALLVPGLAASQDFTESRPADQQQPSAETMPISAAAPVTVHGVVRNAVSGEPIARALVHIEGDAANGALTDGEGKFELTGVAVGPQLFEVVKPGYFNRPPGPPLYFVQDNAVSAHNVLIAPGMSELAFTLAPDCTIHGDVTLSSGDSAQGITLFLLKRGVQDGRAVWQQAGGTKTLSDGSYRFSGLTDGVYIVYSLPAMDSDSAANLIASGRSVHVLRQGYPSVFYPDARDLTGAAKIHLANGDQVQANLNLALEPFYPVTAKAALPENGAAGWRSLVDPASMGFSAMVADAQGHRLPYGAQYDAVTHTIQTSLPDGTYSLLLSASARLTAHLAPGSELQTFALAVDPQVGWAEFTVAGHALPNLRIPITTPRTNPVQFTVNHSASATVQPVSGQERNPIQVMIAVSEAGGPLSDGMTSNFAQGGAGGTLDAIYTSPGSYWVHTHFEQRGLCESSFTAGGANLAREPLSVGVSGSTAPLELTARDDCAKLTLNLPPADTTIASGEEPFFTIYVVPDFDSTADVEPVVMRPTSGSTYTIDGLTPGSYHVYSFTSPVVLEYRNRDALSSLPNAGQAVTLSPGATANLVLEAPAQ